MEKKEYFSDVLIADGNARDGDVSTISYRTGMLVYEESFKDGHLVGRGWNGSGFIPFYDGRVDVRRGTFGKDAFLIEIDGQELISGWELVGTEVKENSKPVSTMPRPFDRHVIVTLKNKIRPVTVKVHTGLDGTPVLTRWLEITNDGKADAAIAQVSIWSGALLESRDWRNHLNEGTALYSLGYMHPANQLYEGDFRWVDLTDRRQTVEGRAFRNRHRHPMFVLRNNATGEHFIGQFAWSGGYAFEFDLEQESSEALIKFKAGLSGPAPQRVLAPGETVTTPEMHMGMVFRGLDEAVQSMIDHQRRSVLMAQPRGRGCWIESGIGPEIEITEEEVWHALDSAVKMGAEIFFYDASWYSPPNQSWGPTVGDWTVNRERFPKGLKPFADFCHEHGMLWGLWMESERFGRDSKIIKEHPDWQLRDYRGEFVGGMIDLTKPEVAKWMEEQIANVIEENHCDFFRLDHNVHGVGALQLDGYVENYFWRYNEALYGIHTRIRERFPNVVYENCASGGGRTDMGLVRLFSHTWVTDWQIAPRAFTITNGMTMALPPERVSRLVGGQTSFRASECEFQWRLLLFNQPNLSFLTPRGAEVNPQLLGQMKHYIDIYRNFITPWMPQSRIFHHTPVAETPEPKGWGVIEMDSRNGKKGICGLFQLSSPSEPEYLLRMRGLDASLKYKVTFDNSRQTCEVDGFTLVTQGINIRLEGALTSELLLFEAM